jgi:hypothetical protein
MRAATATRVHTVDRTERNFVHSAISASVNSPLRDPRTLARPQASSLGRTRLLRA